VTCDQNNNNGKKTDAFAVMMNSQCQIKQKAEAINPENSQRFTAKDTLFNTWCHHLNLG